MPSLVCLQFRTHPGCWVKVLTSPICLGNTCCTNFEHSVKDLFFCVCYGFVQDMSNQSEKQEVEEEKEEEEGGEDGEDAKEEEQGSEEPEDKGGITQRLLAIMVSFLDGEVKRTLQIYPSR